MWFFSKIWFFGRIKKIKKIIVENNFPQKIGSILIIQIISYFKYSLMIPLVLFYASIIGFIGVAVFGLIDISNPNLLTILFKIFRVPPSVSLHLNAEDILKIYGYLSLIFYLIGTLIEQSSKTKLSLSLTKKIKRTTSINILLSLLIFFITYFIMKSPIITCLSIFLGFLWFGITATIFAFVAYILEKIANYLQKPI